MQFGWRPAEVLEMPARQFFAVMGGAKKLRHERDAEMLYELVQVALCAQADAKWVNQLKGLYLKRFKPDADNAVPDEVAAARLRGVFGGVGRGK